MIALFLLGIVVGVLVVLLIEYFLFLNPFAAEVDDPGFAPQFTPFRIPIELKQLLLSSGACDRLKKPETCLSLNFLIHFLYQEFRSTRAFRRWVVSRLQMELNDLVARTTAGRLLQDIRIRDFSVGNQFPVIKEVHVEKVSLADDNESFEELDLILSLEYRGGFQLSVDVTAVLGRRAFLSVKVTRLAGQARLRLSRHPFTHWSLAFTQEPVMDFAVDSQFHGRPLPQLVPVIIQQFRRAVRRKHVLPQYKVRYRPFFANPLLQPSANVQNFAHVRSEGVLQVHLRSSSRLNLAAGGHAHTELFCQMSLASKPFVQGSSLHYVSMVIRFVRHNRMEPSGLSFSKVGIVEKGPGSFVQVSDVKSGSGCARAGFRVGDVILAMNNLPITTEKQASKLLENTSGELVVLVERKLANIENEDDIAERLVSSQGSDSSLTMKCNQDGFVEIGFGFAKNDVNSASNLQKAHSESDLAGLVGSKSVGGDSLDSQLEVEAGPSPIRKARSSLALHSSASEEKEGAVESAFVPIKPESVPPADFDSSAYDGPVVTVSPPPGEEVRCPPSPTPSLSRRQRITAKATEQAAKVAEKWTVGKGMVKELWQKRRNEGTESFEVPMKSGILYVPDADSIGGIPSSRSVESELSNCVGAEEVSLDPELNGEMEVENKLLKPRLIRSRSQSEPDTYAVFVEKTEEMEEIRVVDAETADDAVGNSGNRQEMISHETPDEVLNRKDSNTITKETKSVPLKSDVFWEQNSVFELNEKSRYLNLTFWSRRSKDAAVLINKKDGKPLDPDPVLMGHTSIFIPEIREDCSVTLSNYHEQSFPLRPPHDTVVPRKYQKLVHHPGFDPRLCYGDVTVGFKWYPEGTSPDLNQDNIEGEVLLGKDGGAGESSRAGHKWISTHFQHAVFCSLCQRKIWLKTASQCSLCLMICHRKCQPKADEILTCGGRGNNKMVLDSDSVGGFQPASAGAYDIIDLHEAEGAAEAVTVSMDDQQSSRSSVGKGRKIQQALTEKISILRRRKPHSEAEKQPDAGVSLGNAALSYRDLLPEDEKLKPDENSAEWGQDGDQFGNLEGSLDRSSQFHTLLYTRGGTYNEHVIHVAKDLGKDLFSDLELQERKEKINEQINILQKDIDAATQQRLEILQETKGSASSVKRKESSSELTRIDDKLQALAVLMLHYCAGLQHCLDLEESASPEEPSVSLDEEKDGKNLEESAELEHTCVAAEELTEVNVEGQAVSDQHNKDLLQFLVSSQTEK